MQGKKEFNQRIYYNINLDCLVPENHLLKRIQKLISFDFVRDITKSYYSHTGKPSIDPTVLIKMLLVGYLFDIRSERKLVEDISLNLAYRWYPDFDSKNGQKKAKTPLNTGILAFSYFHKYVVYQLIFCFLPKYFLSPPDEVFFS